MRVSYATLPLSYSKKPSSYNAVNCNYTIVLRIITDTYCIPLKYADSMYMLSFWYTHNKIHAESLAGTTQMYDNITMHSRDDKGIDIAHKIISPINQPQFYQMMTGQYWLDAFRSTQMFCYGVLKIFEFLLTDWLTDWLTDC